MRRRLAALALMGIVSGLLACSGKDGGNPVGPTPPGGLDLELVGSFNLPVLVTAPRGDTRLFVVEQEGVIRLVKNDTIQTTPFLDITGLVLLGDEQGLLGLAFDPLYAQNGRFFVMYTDNSADQVVARYHVSADPDVAVPTQDEVVITIPDPEDNHNGGTIAFGPDGMLYVSMGDGGGANDPYDSGQGTDDLLGAILRIDVSAGSGYSIPADNPFPSPARRELWSIGLRNPYRFSFDRQTGDLYIGDVGQDEWEEVDVGPNATGRGRGANYGWSIAEGNHCFQSSSCNTSGLTPPVLEYAHADGACTVIGGYVYRGTRIAGLAGTYFYADYCANWVRSFHYAGGSATQGREWPDLNPGANITSFGEDGLGELYITTETGPVYRFVAAPAPQARTN